MSRPGFEKRLRQCLASDELEEQINSFLHINARRAFAKSDLSEQKSDNTVIEGEFSLEAHDIWKRYLVVIESVIEDFRRSENLSVVEFRQAVELVDEKNSYLIKLMIASWEFESFMDMCREYVIDNNDNDDESESKRGDIKREEKVRLSSFISLLSSNYLFIFLS